MVVGKKPSAPDGTYTLPQPIDRAIALCELALGALRLAKRAGDEDLLWVDFARTAESLLREAARQCP